MKTRMEKYYDEENNNIALRQRKNEKLYENITIKFLKRTNY